MEKAEKLVEVNNLQNVKRSFEDFLPKYYNSVISASIRSVEMLGAHSTFDILVKPQGLTANDRSEVYYGSEGHLRDLANRLGFDLDTVVQQQDQSQSTKLWIAAVIALKTGKDKDGHKLYIGDWQVLSELTGQL